MCFKYRSSKTRHPEAVWFPSDAARGLFGYREEQHGKEAPVCRGVAGWPRVGEGSEGQAKAMSRKEVGVAHGGTVPTFTRTLFHFRLQSCFFMQ